MPKSAREITRDDLLDIDEYAPVRKARRLALLPAKKLRRVAIGPDATAYFENYDTMWLQVQDMLYTEKGGEAQIADELAAYNPLIPKGHELVATIMFEIANEARRDRFLRSITGIERHIFLQIGDHKIYAVPEGDVERTAPDGKTSSVHFVRFAFGDADIKAWNDASTPVMLCMDHPAYAHCAVLSDETRSELARDF